VRRGMERSGRMLEPYDIQQAEGSTDLQCMVDGCHKSVEDFEALVMHIYKHSVKNEMRCILCPKDQPTKYGRDVLFFKINEPNKPTLFHIRRHLPPQIQCPNCTAVFCTQENLDRHSKQHVPGYIPKDRSGDVRSKTPCKWGCGLNFDDQKKRHFHEDKECLKREHDVNRLYKCTTCGRIFETRTQMRNHEHAAHKRSVEVSGILSEIGINIQRPLGSDLIRENIQGVNEDHENEYGGFGGLLEIYDHAGA
jgi:DNA-directed RNA polymerase subunit RPC12/RpoP